jgi:O-antigen/teichoic acid export membrane protein
MFGALPDALLRQEINFKRLSQSKMIGVVCGSTLTLILAYNGFEVWSLVYGSILSVAVQTMALFIARPVMLAPSFRFDGIGAMVSFGGYITASRILWFLYSRIDVFIVGKLLGSATLGFFSVARNIAMMPMSKVGAIVNLVAFPAYSELQHKRAALKSSFYKAVNINALIFFPALWGISAIAADLVPLVLGAIWLETAPLLQIICLVVPIRSLATMLSPVLNGLGRLKFFCGTP